MKIGFLLPTVFASQKLYPDRIFAPLELAVNTVNGLAKNGHDVIVFSVPDFPAENALLIEGYTDYIGQKIPIHKLRNENISDRNIRSDEVLKRNFELAVSTTAYNYAKKQRLDIIHAYHDFVFTPHYLQNLTNVKTVYTLHDPLPPANTFEYQEFSKFVSHNYVSISNSQRKSELNLNFIDTVYHGIDLAKFPFNKKASDYLLFMGRLVPEKGLHHAIKVALEINIQLEIGTQFPDKNHEDEYFKTQIKPHINNPLIGEPGMVKGDDKILLYKQAKALLFPISWEEPFGMVMIEAMACGTPVIAFNRGSVSEIVKDGVTGFIGEPEESVQATAYRQAGLVSSVQKKDWIIKKTGVAGLVEAVNRISEINRVNCRKHVEENFTVEKMVAGYEKVYQKIAFRN